MYIDDAMLEKLGMYFVSQNIYARYSLTFESFIERWKRGIIELEV